MSPQRSAILEPWFIITRWKPTPVDVCSRNLLCSNYQSRRMREIIMLEHEFWDHAHVYYISSCVSCILGTQSKQCHISYIACVHIMSLNFYLHCMRTFRKMNQIEKCCTGPLRIGCEYRRECSRDAGQLLSKLLCIERYLLLYVHRLKKRNFIV